MHNRFVIFIGGSSYSGSTLLDMILSNSPGGFSCGELNALYYPYRRHHLNPECGCGDPRCRIWTTIRKSGPDRAYHSIFEMFPDVTYIVDSSKDPMWIYDRTRALAGSGIGVKNILIWKTPEEFFASRDKRQRQPGWERAWLNYHRLYFRLIREWRSIAYRELATDPSALKKLCQALGVPCSEGQSRYWDKTHHTLFGNTSAKIHLYNEASEKFRECETELSQQKSPDATMVQGSTPVHRAVYYRPADSGFSVPGVSEAARQVAGLLSAGDISAIPGREQPPAMEQEIGKMSASLFLYSAHRLRVWMLSLARTVLIAARVI